MDPRTFGPLRVHVRGGDDRLGGGDGPAILLCHGFGASGEDLVSLARVIHAGPRVRWFFPEAPVDVEVGPGMRGRAWWDIGMERLMTLLMRGDIEGAMKRLDEVPEGLAPARDALIATIEALEKECGVRRDQLLVGGFSQGAMLTTELVTHLREPFAGLAVLSGTRLGGERWQEGFDALGPKLSAFLSHGRRDQLLPFGRAEVLRDMMTTAKANVTWVPHGGAHEIPQVVVNGLGAFAQERLGTA